MLKSKHSQEDMGPAWLTDTLHRANTLPLDNRVAPRYRATKHMRHVSA